MDVGWRELDKGRHNIIKGLERRSIGQEQAEQYVCQGSPVHWILRRRLKWVVQGWETIRLEAVEERLPEALKTAWFITSHVMPMSPKAFFGMDQINWMRIS